MRNDISVVVPCFNNASTILKSLASIESQTLAASEVIIVDDCSRDNTVALVSNFIRNSSLPVALIKNDVNRGPSYCRNVGIKRSTGKYIAFLDADDVWLPRKLERQYQFMKETGAFLSGHLARGCGGSKDADVKAVSFVSMLHRNPFVTPSVMFKNSKEYFFDEDMRYCEDHDLWARIAHRHSCFLLSDELVELGRVPLTAGGLSEKRKEMRIGELYMYKKLYKSRAIAFLTYAWLTSFSIVKHIEKTLSHVFVGG